MGAIAGVFHRRGAPVDRSLLAGQSRVLAHRGGQGEDVWTADSVGFLHRRDAVAPPIAPGQPVADASGRYWMVASGRVFNAPALAEELRRGGHPAGGTAILEVMLRCYVHWGHDAFRRFNGAFACAVWDRENRTLTLARDPIGIKPLFCRVTADAAIFASEVKAIFAHPSVAASPDETGIANYLCCNRYLLASPRTFYSGIERVQPGTVTVVSPDSVRTETTWTIDPGRVDERGSFDEWTARTRELLIDAVRIRLPEGDRVGAASSGGFDSSSVVSLVAHVNSLSGARKRIDTFSFDFGTPEADEPEIVDAVARHAGATHHHTPVLSPDFLDETDDLIRANDGPTMEDSVLLLWKKKRRAHEEGIAVMLSGLGGDELFMGRPNYLADLLRTLRWGELLSEIKSVYPYNRNQGKRTSLRKLLKSYALAPLEPYWMKNARRARLASPFPPPWVSRELSRRTGVGSALPNPPRPRFRSIYRQDCFDVFLFELVNGAVPYHDVAGARWSIDTRFPLLDIRLVESMFMVPRRWKMHRGEVRLLQKQAMDPFLPREVLEQHVKRDFHPVLNAFLRDAYRRELRPLLGAAHRRSDDYLDWRVVAAYFEAFDSGRVSNPYPLWAAINLERWLRSAFA